jgi:hypothetical protein
MLTQYVNALQENLANSDSPLTLFVDWHDLTRYDSHCREVLTRWVLDSRLRLQSMKLLVRSPFVVMGVTVANALIGNFITVTRENSLFIGELQHALMERQVRAQATSFSAHSPNDLRLVKHPL